MEEGRRCYLGLSHDLHAGRVKHGAKLEDVLAVYKPDVVFVHGPYTTAGYCCLRGYYFSSLDYTLLVARDGKLVRAEYQGCVRRPRYFDSLTEAESQEWGRGYYAAYMQFRNENVLAARQSIAGMSVGGPIALIVHRFQQ